MTFDLPNGSKGTAVPTIDSPNHVVTVDAPAADALNSRGRISTPFEGRQFISEVDESTTDIPDGLMGQVTRVEEAIPI